MGAIPPTRRAVEIPSMTDVRRHVECTIPVLQVRDLQRSLRFYTDTLGFTLDWGGEEGKTVCSVSKDGCHIMLLETPAANGAAWVWIGVADDALFQQYAARGVEVVQDPRNYAWAYEMKFCDPDGNVLWLGTEPRRDLPLES